MGNSKQQKIDTIRGLLDGSITLDQIDDRLEVFLVDGIEDGYKVNGKEVGRAEFLVACKNNPKDSRRSLGSITIHGDERYAGEMPDEYYV